MFFSIKTCKFAHNISEKAILATKLKEIANALEMFAPLPLQDGYDNAGLQIGLTDAEVTGVLLCLDVTEQIIDEAVASGCNLIVSHHPLLFRPLKRITGSNYVERCVIKALSKGIAIYSAHTNLDNAAGGVNYRIAQKIGLKNIRILQPKENALLKLAVYVPTSHADTVRDALFAAGCGAIGGYDCCSYNINGTGTFRAGEMCTPFCGEKGDIHHEPEVRIETILPTYLKSRVVSAILKAHPYEEPAFDIYPIQNEWNTAGSGVIGELETESDELEFLKKIKTTFNVECIRHTALRNKTIKHVALCGGAGASFANAALAAGADIYITGEARYHELFDNTNRMMHAIIGHYESEQYTMEIFQEIISKKFPHMHIKITDLSTNPLRYL